MLLLAALGLALLARLLATLETLGVPLYESYPSLKINNKACSISYSFILVLLLCIVLMKRSSQYLCQFLQLIFCRTSQYIFFFSVSLFGCMLQTEI